MPPFPWPSSRSRNRTRRASASNGTVDGRPRLRYEAFLILAIALAAMWMAWSFVLEIRFTHDLGRQAAELRRQNAALQSQDAGYRRDIVASSSGAAAEEEARQNGYSKPSEKVFVIGAATPRAAVPSAPASASAATSPAVSPAPSGRG